MPMFMGFGCSVPAMINTRTLADEKEKTATIRVIPFFSCGAKLPILTAIAGAIVSMSNISNPDIITYSMYVLGVVVAIISVLIMRSTSMKGDNPPFIMELPSYHLPQFKSLMLHLWDKLKHYIHKAFTIILASAIVVWFLSSFNFRLEFLPEIIENPELGSIVANLRMDESILAKIGSIFTFVFAPLGFGSNLNAYSYIFVVAAVTGLIAKENVISTFGTLAACVAGSIIASEDGVAEVSAIIKATGITVPALISFIAFNMTTIPCFATVATAKAELKNKTFKMTLLFWIIVSFIVSMMVYLGFDYPWTLPIFVVVIALLITLVIFINKHKVEIVKK